MSPRGKASRGPACANSPRRRAGVSDFLRRRNVRSFYLPLALLSLLAVLLRILMSVQVVSTDPSAYNPPDVTDMATYHMLSRGILNGVFPAEFVYQPFYYAVFLPAVKFLLRTEFMSVGIAQSVCVGVVVWCAGLIGAMLRSRRTGLLAAFLCAFSTMLFFYVPYALIEIQQAMWFTVLLYFTLRAMKTGRILHFTLTGLILSFAILSRGNAWCFLPAVALAFIVALRRKRFPARGKALLAAVVCLGAIVIPQMPFAVRNTLATHSPAGPSTAGPAVLTLGNNPEAPPGSLPIPYPPTYDEWMDHAAERSVPLRILDWFRAEPLAFIVLQIEKFFLFFDSHEIPNNIRLGVNASESSVFRMFGIIPTSLLIALALAAFFMSFRRARAHKSELMLWLFLFLYVFAAAAFYVLARFRVPVIPLFAIGAALFVSDLWRTARGGRERPRRLLPYCPALLAGVYFVWFFYPAYRASYEPRLMALARPDGVRLETAKMFLEHDNGPNYLDGWMAAGLDGGVTVAKSFSARGLDPAKYSKAYVTATFCTDRPLVMDAVCNGKAEAVELSSPGLNPVRFGPFPVSPDLTFSFSFPRLPPDQVGLAVDFHRDYGRTTYRGEVFPAEAVIRLELEP